MKHGKVTSVKDINIEESYSFISEGVNWHTNPIIECAISENGSVINTRTKKLIKKNEKSGLYGVRFIGDELTNPMSWSSLVKYLIGIDKKRFEEYALIDEKDGWNRFNIKVIPSKNKPGRKKGTKVKKSNQNYKTISLDEYNHSSLVEINTFKCKQIIKEPVFITEDNKVFHDKKEAYDHQLNVDAGKASAEIIINNKAGYKIAEMIFLQHVKYEDNIKPYENFKEVYENDSGVIGNSDAASYRFEYDSRLDEMFDLLSEKDLSKSDVEDITKNVLEIEKLKDSILSKLV